MPTEREILNCLVDIKGYVIEPERCETNRAERKIIFWLEPEGEGTCSCCGRPSDKVKDRKVRKYRDLHFGAWTAEIWIEKRRVICERCGVKSEQVSFADARSKCTRRLEIAVFTATVDDPLSKAARHFGLSWDAVRCIERKYLLKWEQYKGPPAGVKWLGIDEVCFGKKDNLYSVISDLEKGEVLAVVSGNSQSSIDSFFVHVGSRFCNGIQAVCVDMWKAFENSVRKYCKNAKIIYDKFHIIRHLNNAIDEVRRAEFFRKGGNCREMMKGKRWLLLRRWFNLSKSQKCLLKSVFMVNRKISKAHYLKEIFGHLWFYKSKTWALKFLKRWRSELRWQRLKPLEKFYSMIERHLEGILNYCETKLPLGLVENINGRIKTLLRRTRGFKDERHFALRIMFMTDSTTHNFLTAIHS